MWTSIANSILLESLLNKKFSRIFFILLITGFWSAGAGVLDSVVRPPPLPSIDEAIAIELRFDDPLVDFCQRPGSILHYASDSTCSNPVWSYVSNYWEDPDDSGDTLAETPGQDSLDRLNFLVAMHTFDKFGTPMKKLSKTYSFSHDIFIGYLEEEEPILEKSWLIEFFEKVFEIIDKYIIQPFLHYLIAPIVRLSLFWKIVLFVVSVSLFIFVIAIVARFTAKFYPQPTVSAGRRKQETGTVCPMPIDWLQKAQAMYSQGSLCAASEYMYHYLLSWTLERNRIKRYEWWTNRQLLLVFKKRFNNDYKTARDIIDAYEFAVYGHTPVDANSLGQLIERAAILDGRKTS